MPIRRDLSTPQLPASQQFEWSDVRYFLAVVETGNLTKAAQLLNTTQPTVSRRMDELEMRLGVQLLHRDTTPVTLTETGRFVADQAMTMARAALAISQEAGMVDMAPAGEVTLACPDGLANYFLAAELARFQRAYPEIRLELRTRTDPLRAADITIQFQEAKRMDDVAVPLGWVHHVGVTSRSYVELFGMPQSVVDAVNHKVITHIDYAEQTDRWRPKVKPLQDLLDFVVRSDSGSFMVNAVAGGAGVASLPSYVSRFDPRLIVVDEAEHARLRFWAVFDRARGELPRIRETVNWLKSVFDPRANPWFREEFIHPSEFDIPAPGSV